MFSHNVVPTAPPHNVRAISANTTSITVAWDPVPCIERNSEIVDYRVRLLLRHSGAVIVNGVNTGAELGYTATGLLPGTSYNFRVDSVSVGNILGTMAGLLSYDTRKYIHSITYTGIVCSTCQPCSLIPH